jgi:hypothetical protein
MTDHKKKGDFDKARKHDIGGNKKARMKGESDSRTGHKQNAGTADGHRRYGNRCCRSATCNGPESPAIIL